MSAQEPLSLNSASVPSVSSAWNIQLLGALRAEMGGMAVTRFRTRKAAALLAYLALFPGRAHTREELADKFWPDVDPESGRTSLRSALASLRRQLEPPGVPAGAVLGAQGRDNIRLEPEAVAVDVARFEALLKGAARTPTADPDGRARQLTDAVALYRGPLLPGFYETWALSERDRLAEAYLRALGELTGLHEKGDRLDAALECARRAVSADPLREEAHADVIRLLVSRGEMAAAQRHYQQTAKLFEEQLGAEPSPSVRRPLDAPAPARTPQPKVELAPPAAPYPPSPHAPAERGHGGEETSPPIIGGGGGHTPAVHLPLTLTRFFGRERELDALGGWMDAEHVRLVTVTGPGGSGKTRFAVEAARRVANGFPGGVWFVPLGDLRDPDLVGDAIAGTLGVARGRADQPAVAQVAAALRRAGGPALLVLDNFEQLVDAADDDGIPGYDENSGPDAVRRLLLEVPGLKCLVTSRQRLLVEGEQEFPLLPLPAPEVAPAAPAAPASAPPAPAVSPESLSVYPSVQLFIARAQAARPDFQLTERNADAVARLCARLEGIPLAIELCAAWAQTLSPAQMLARLEQGSDLLVSRRRDIPGRHATLRAAVAWSYELLPDDLRKFFARLAPFRGGWTLEAAEAVTGETRTLEFLTELRERSLLVVEESGAAEADEDAPADGDGSDDYGASLRFRMLETLREFAAEAAEADPTDAAACVERHLSYFLAMAEEASAEGPGNAAGMRSLAREQDNLRAALDGALADTAQPYRVARGLRLAGTLSWFWLVRGYWAEGLHALARALRASEAAHGRDADVTSEIARLRAHACRGAGWLAWRTHDSAQAVAYSERGLALARACGSRGAAAFCLATLGLAAHHADQTEDRERAGAMMDESIALAREIGKPWLLGHCLSCNGHVLLRQQRHEEARACFEEGLIVLRGHGDRYGVAEAQRALAHLFLGLGMRERARETIEDAIATFRSVGDLGTVGLCTLILGFLASDENDHDTARTMFETALVRCREGGDRFGMAHALHNRAYTWIHGEKWAEARTDFVESLGLFRELGYSADVAMSLEGFAHLAAKQGQWERAVRLRAAAQALRESFGAVMADIHRERLDADRAAAVAAVGEEKVRAAWSAGSALTADMAVAYAQGAR